MRVTTIKKVHVCRHYHVTVATMASLAVTEYIRHKVTNDYGYVPLKGLSFKLHNVVKHL